MKGHWKYNNNNIFKILKKVKQNLNEITATPVIEFGLVLSYDTFLAV